MLTVQLLIVHVIQLSYIFFFIEYKVNSYNIFLLFLLGCDDVFELMHYKILYLCSCVKFYFIYIFILFLNIIYCIDFVVVYKYTHICYAQLLKLLVGDVKGNRGELDPATQQAVSASTALAHEAILFLFLTLYTI